MATALAQVQSTKAQLQKMSSEELVGLLPSDAAFEVLYAKHRKGAHAYANRMLASADDADDVVQEAFIRVAKHAHTFERKRAKFNTWFIEIVRNLALNILRWRRSHRVKHTGGILSENGGSKNRDLLVERECLRPDVGLEIKENVNATLRLLADLPPEHHNTVYLRSEGYTYREIAILTSAKIGTVRSRLHRGRMGVKRLRAGLPLK